MSKWTAARLGDIARFQNGRAFKPSEWSLVGLPIIRIENLTDSSAPFNRFEGQVDERHLVRDGDLLVSWSASLDAFIWNRGVGVLNQHIFKVAEDARLVDRSYFFHALRYSMTAIRTQIHGATMQHITKPAFEAVTVPLPPLHEQRRIAAHLSSVIGEACAARDAVEARNGELDGLRRSAVTAAFRSASRPVTTALGSIGRLVDGDWILNADYAPSGVRLLQVGDVGRGRLTIKSNRHITAERATELKCTLLKQGDVLISRMPEPLGRACALPDLGYPCITAVDVAIMRIDPGRADLDYLTGYLNSQEWYAAVEAKSSGATRPRISRKNLELLPVPLPSLPEQRRIAARLLEQLAEIDNARAALEAQRKAVDALPAALLREVFGLSPVGD